MRKPTPEISDERLQAFREAISIGGDMPLRLRLHHLAAARDGYAAAQHPEVIQATDELLARGLEEIRRTVVSNHAELRAQVKQLIAPPHFPAVYLGTADEGRARVSVDGAGERIVAVRDGVSGLEPGDFAVLSAERNVIIGKIEPPRTGDLARFERLASGGQVVVVHHSEELLCQPVNGLEVPNLKSGDSILIDPRNRLAIEKVEDEKSAPLPFLLERIEGLSEADIGGLDPQLAELMANIKISFDRDRADRYRLERLLSILLQGPPGTGKTHLVRIACSLLARSHGHAVRFLSIRPSEWVSQWVGVTERNIRNAFAAIRRVAVEDEDGYTVVYFDEVESFGRLRGSSGQNTYRDDFTNVLLAELDGFKSLARVAVVSSTNRPDLLDPAFRERICQIHIEVPRPRMEAARAILRVHLKESDPWADAGACSEGIESAVGLLFLGEDNAVCRIGFNDGTIRVVKAPELLSGRMLMTLATNARRRAARREAEAGTEDGGIEVEDVIEAAEAGLEGLRAVLSRDNARSHLSDLPQDLKIVSVEAVRPKPTHPHHYLNT